MADTIRTWLLMFAINSPVYFLLGWVLFRNWADFWHAVKREFWPSDYGEEYWDTDYAEAKLVVWFFLPIGLIGLEMWLLGW